jgi:hypothetical protein
VSAGAVVVFDVCNQSVRINIKSTIEVVKSQDEINITSTTNPRQVHQDTPDMNQVRTNTHDSRCTNLNASMFKAQDKINMTQTKQSKT